MYAKIGNHCSTDTYSTATYIMHGVDVHFCPDLSKGFDTPTTDLNLNSIRDPIKPGMAGRNGEREKGNGE